MDKERRTKCRPTVSILPYLDEASSGFAAPSSDITSHNPRDEYNLPQSIEPSSDAFVVQNHGEGEHNLSSLDNTGRPGAYAAGGAVGRNLIQRLDPAILRLNSNSAGGVYIGDGDENTGHNTDAGAEQQYAVARAVEDHSASITEAQQVDPEEILRKQGEITEQRKKQCRMVVYATLLVIGSIGLVSAAVGLTLRRDQKSSSAPPTMAPSMSPPSDEPSSVPSSDLEGLAAMEFPNYTLRALENPLSPQYLAYQWLSEHPNIASMEEWEMTQLFATVTFFFAMDGQHWPKLVRDDWLDYDRSLCDWFSSQHGHFNPFSSNTHYTTTSRGTACNENGELVVLSLQGLDLALLQSPTIPPEIGLISSLEEIWLVLNHFQAVLSEFIPVVTFPRLSTLILRGNHLSGTIPSELGLMSKLTYLDLNDNNLTGPLPTELFQLTDLEHLALASCMLSDMPTELGKLTKLTGLDLGANQLVAIPSEIFRMTSLHGINLGMNHIQEKMPSELGMLNSMQDLRLDTNLLSGSIPTQLAKLSDLIVLQLSDNLLTGQLMNFGFPTLPNMLNLQLSNNALSGSLPSDLGLLTSLGVLFLNYNNFAGPIPTELGLVQHLFGLHLSHNNLSGAIPTEIGLLSNVVLGFHLNSNSLSSWIPTELGLLQSLGGFLDLSGNELSGLIPSELGMLHYLHSLSLDSNFLTGPIPSEIGTMQSLIKLGLSNLLLTDSIPSELATLVSAGFQLRVFNISNNMHLSGSVPEELCFLSSTGCSCYFPSLCESCSLVFDCTDLLCGCGCVCAED